MKKNEHALRADALAIIQAGIAAVEPGRAVLEHLALRGDILVAGESRLELPERGKIFVVGMGKAAGPMTAAVEAVLGDRISGGVAVTKYGHGAPLSRIELLEAGHPVPDAAGLSASRRVAEILELAGRQDLVICLVSGGGSALLPAPAPGITLEDKMAATRLLLECGARINEINTVRKHLSFLKGGGFARLAAPARLLTLILSDVVGDPLDVIASGPTVPDPTTYADALGILTRYGLERKVPLAVRKHLEKGGAGELPETPKPGAGFFAEGINLLVGNNSLAVMAAAERARSLGYGSLILSTTVTGETREVAAVHAAIAREVLGSGNPLPAPACILSGGETTVTIRGNGKGGRNQEFALAAALEIEGLTGVIIGSVGTDGTDGPTDAAGALADGKTAERARSAGLDPEDFLKRNDSYHFFQALNDLVMTGPTNTNVMDLRLALVAKPQGQSQCR